MNGNLYLRDCRVSCKCFRHVLKLWTHCGSHSGFSKGLFGNHVFCVNPMDWTNPLDSTPQISVRVIFALDWKKLKPVRFTGLMGQSSRILSNPLDSILPISHNMYSIQPIFFHGWIGCRVFQSTGFIKRLDPANPASFTIQLGLETYV